MGNAHPGQTHISRIERKKKFSEKMRRRSVPAKDPSLELPHTHPNHTSFSFGLSLSRGASPNSTTPPKIQINGMDSFDDLQVHTDTELSSRDVSPFPPIGKPASIRRMEFLTSSGNLTVRSLDDGHIAEVDLQMKPLGRTKSLSPLKQMRTYSYRSLNSEENALDQVHCSAIRQSWKMVIENTRAHDREFAYFVFDRIFERQPKLKTLFKVDDFASLGDVPADHEFPRHAKLFTNIIDLAVRNVDELEQHIAPVLFKYGERHYSAAINPYFNEETVRMFCGQVVCSIADLMGEGVQPVTMEAWIEMMRYLGRKLLDGHEYARIGTKRRISINKNDHHLFLML